MVEFSHRNANSSQRSKPLKLGRRMNDKKSVDLFRNVIYAVDEALPALLRSRIRNILQNNGGSMGDPEEILESQTFSEVEVPNLYISQTNLYPYPTDNEVQSVTPLWIEKAMQHGFVHDPKFYSPGYKQFLSGVVLLLLDLPNVDCNPIKNEIERYGGQHRDEFTSDVTHLICFDPRGTYYNQCIEQDIPVVLPQWLDDSFKYQEKMDEDLYSLPDPIAHHEYNPIPADLFTYGDNDALAAISDNLEMVFEDQVIYFGRDIHIKEEFKTTLFEAISNAGGTIADQYSHHYVTIVILKHRGTQECRMASKDQKMIASLWWITNTLFRGYLTSPLSTLLDYPTPPGGLPGMDRFIITISGYGSLKKYYLRRLVIALGATYTKNITANTTHLICGRNQTSKYNDASDSMNIAIVNHIWLEECYRQWRIVDRDDNIYTYIPIDKTIMDTSVGRSHLFVNDLARWMEPETTPNHILLDDDSIIHNQNIEDGEGSIKIRKRRRAAINATRVLNDIVIPDVNAYQKERSQKVKKERH